MTTENNTAAQADPLDAFVQEIIDQDSQQMEQENHQVDSAPAEEETEHDDAELEVNDESQPEGKEHKSDGFQKRINKVTADKYEAIRRAEELQAKLDALQKANEKPLEAPTLEAHDYDEDAFNQANVQYQVQQELQRQAEAQKAAQAEIKAQQAQQAFNERIASLNKEDFADKANAIPQLPPGIADALIEADNGPEIIYYLGSHLDKADSIASMSPAQALMEIGRLSTNLNKKPEIKTSAAPEPIEPLKAGSAVTDDIGSDMSIEAWMAKYG